MFLEISFVYLIHKLNEWGAQRLIPQIMTDVVAFKNQILQTIFHMLYIIFFSQVKQKKKKNSHIELIHPVKSNTFKIKLIYMNLIPSLPQTCI